jgi:V8-like Glu-specific endopeptidase
MCGGVIVNHQQILSAAHCFKFMDYVAKPAGIHVYVGSNKYGKGRHHAVKEVVIHSGYIEDDRDVLNDIAILTVEQPISFTDTIQPACLPSKPAKAYIGQGLVVSGWGRTERDWPSNDLKVLKDINILDNCTR